MKRQYFYTPNGKLVGWFQPTSKLRPNRMLWDAAGGLQAAKLIAGFNVGKCHQWRVEDLVAIVKEVRRTQGHPPNSTFIPQKGLYAHTAEDGVIAEEDGASIVLFNEFGDSEKQFETEMQELAEAIAKQLEQESVIVEFSRGGVVYWTLGIGP